VVQAAQYGASDDLFAPRWLSPLQQLTWDSLPNTLVGSRVVEVGLVLLHCLMEMALAQYKEEVEAFSPHTAQESLANGVGFGCLIGRG